jgi:hypothetical protein
MFKKYLLFFSSLFFLSEIEAQVNGAPDPCTSGSQNTCKCSTSPILCTIEDLNGYEYDMTSFQHAGDGPQPMCPPPEGNGTASQNPTWFAFLSWCTSLTIKVTYTSCTNPPGPAQGGVQAAIYQACPATTNNALTCDTDVGGCSGDGQRILNVSGMIPGNLYYFLVDGCSGSACHIKIDVLGSCSQTEPTPLTTVIGPKVLCKPNASSVFNLIKNEFTQYNWFIDNVPVQNGTYLINPTLNFNGLSAGPHTVCVDGSLPPCIALSDPPAPLCFEVCVTPSTPTGGTINAMTPVCPGVNVPITVTGNNTDPGFVQHVFITNSSGNIIEVVPNNGTSTTLTSSTCENFTVYSLNYYEPCQTPAITPSVGMNITAIQTPCTGTGPTPSCGCDLKSKVVSFADTQKPVFTNPPAGGTFNCIFEAPGGAGALAYTDNCIAPGTVDPVITGGTDPCAGGTITRTWEKTDECGNTATHVQTVTVGPSVIAAFLNVPPNITINCEDQLPLPASTNLNYSNGGSGLCLISGSVPPTIIANYTPCAGGTVIYNWEFTDGCSRTINATRTITINALILPAFVNPPADITIDCNAIPPSIPNLNYTNGMTASCLISGNVGGVYDGASPTICGGVFTRKWTFTDQCNRTITHLQKITVTPVPEGNYLNPPPDITVNCNAIPAAGINLTFSNGLNGPCQISANVVPTSGGFGDQCGGTKYFAWTFTDVCGRTKVDTQFITINPIPQANFINPPGNTTVTCENRPTSLPILQVKNNDLNCPIDASVTPAQTGNVTVCGGNITYNWTYTDVCNRTINHTQVVTVLPLPQAAFVNPPADITVNCNQVPSSGPTLQIKNTGLNACAIDDTVVPVQSGNGNQCGGTITYTWTHTDVCNRVTTHIQNVTINPIPQAAFVNPPGNTTVTCNLVPISGPILVVKNNDLNCPITENITPTQSGSATKCGGTIIYNWTYTDVCNRTINHTQTVTVTPMLEAAFENPPGNITVTCDMIPSSGPVLVAKNNDTFCPINTNVTPTQSGSATICGGTITYTWTFTDECNRTINHTQNVVVTPMPLAAFINPPSDITVTCDLIPTTAPQLQVKNNGPAGCSIDQLITPVQTGSATICGGTITYVWTFTDVCNRTITHTQNIVVTPMPQAAFVNPPSNITVTCDLIPSTAPQLQVKNNGPAGCNIDQLITPVQSGSGTICGGTITYTWTFTDVCNRTITHVQTITIIPMPPAVFINPPSDITVTCDLIPSSGVPLQVKNNGPSGCSIDQLITPVQSGNATICGGVITYTWTFTDVCGRTITHMQNINVTPMPLPQFINPPANVTVNCDAIPTAGPTLTVQNNGPAACNINTTVAPVQSGSATICGGVITYTWSFTDQCGRSINHLQTVTVTPMLAPQFINPPANITVSCGNIPSNAPNLQVTNNGPIGCKIDESVAAVLEGSPNPCGGNYNYKWTYTDACLRTITHIQTITVTPTPQGVFVNAPSNELVNCDQIPAISSFPSLTFTNNLSGSCGINEVILPVVTGSATACGGTIIATWAFTDFCGRPNTHTKTVTVSPAAQATFGTIPPNITVSCEDLDNTPIDVSYNNGGTGICNIQGSIENIRTGTVSSCGGTLQDLWQFTDLCGRTISGSRIVTVLPAPKAVFASLPANITLNCDDIIPANDLAYSNNLSGSCGINGNVAPIQSGNYDACGGTVFITWTFTDLCNRSINHAQVVTVNPADDPDFVDPPQDEDLDCGGVNNPPQFIAVSNGITGPCGININAPLISVTQNGGTYTNTWQYNHPCTNQLFTHVQKTTTIIAPSLFVADPDIELCAGEIFDLSSIVVTDLNNTNPIITFHSTLPASQANEVLPEVMPNPGDIYFIVGTNGEGCTDAVTIYFEVITPPNAGGNGNAQVCNDGSTLNLNSLLNGGAQTGGSWKQINGQNLNLANPSAVNFLNINAGVYGIAYIVQSSSNCPSDTSSFSISVTEKVNLTLAGVACITGGTYEVKIISLAPTVTTSIGTIQKLTNDTIRIFNIPQGQSLMINASSANNVCQASLTIAAPDCSCPFVPEPQGPIYYSNCEQPTLSIPMNVTVPAGMQANWFSVQSAGIPLVSNSTTYNHTNGSPGLYKYYVETYNPITDCYSLSRLEITVEIFSNPQVQNPIYTLCDDGNDGRETFDLSTIVDDIASLSNGFSFHLSLADAQNNLNPIANNYSNITNPQTIYALVTSTSGCKSIATVSLSLWSSPVAIITATPESCVGAADGKITVTHAIPGTYQYNLNNQGWTSNNTFSNLAVGNYILVTEDANGCKSQNNIVIDPGLLILIKTFKFECDNKGTLSDPTDDIYKITLRVENNLNAGGNYSVTGTNGFSNTYAYNTDINFNLPASGTTIDFTIKDVIRGCTASRSIGPLTTCSTTCIADLKVISLECNGNNTPSNPSDDYYIFKFSASSVNGASNNQYNLSVDNVLKGLFTYGVENTINIPATNSLANIKIVDNADVQCTDNIDIGPLNNCSDQCVLNAVIESIECKNPGSTPSPNDDFYEITLKASLINGGTSTSFKVITESGLMFTGTYNVSLKIILPADNLPHKLTFVDNIKVDCKQIIDLNPLTPCSGPCEVEVKIISVVCNSNGTTNDSSDDFYDVTISAKLINGGTSDSYKATVDGMNFNGIYGTNLKIQLPADGKTHLINVVDLISVECKGNVQTDLLIPCSVPCNVNATVLTYDCDNGGTTSDTSDDTYKVSILVNISNGSGTEYTATVDNKTYVGTYGTALIIPFIADNVVHTINIKDNTNGVCTATIQTPILAPCSGPCVIDVVISNVECNNAGTNNTTEDDEYYFEILVTGNNTKWKIDQLNATGNVGNKLKLGPYKIKDAISSFLVYYENSPNCKKQMSIIIPPTCSECKQTVDAGNGGKLSCAQNAILLSATSSTAGTYSWSLNGNAITNTLTYSAGEAGKYYFEAAYADGCKAIDSVIVTVDADLPVASVTREHLLTCTIKEVTITATVSGNNLLYEWTDEAGVVLGNGLTIKVTKEGKYYFRAYNPTSGCSSAKLLSEVLKDEGEPSSVIYAKPTTIFDCVIKKITLFNDSQSDVVYTWLNNGNQLSKNKTVEISSIGNYKLIAIDTISGCRSESELIISSLIEYPIINLSLQDTLDCVTEKVFVSSLGSQVGSNITYEWKDKDKKTISTNQTGIDVTEPGIFYLVLVDVNNGCTNEDTIKVESFENEIDIKIPLTIYVKAGDSVRLNALLNIPNQNIKKITWTPKDKLTCSTCVNTIAVTDEDITYKIEVEDIFGCKGFAEVRLIITKPDEVNIPNVISTTSGTNGGFTLYGNDQVKLINKLAIYDRWGNLMFTRKNFEPNKPELGWDGRFNGKDVVQGVFVYIFEVDINGSGKKIFTGDLTVLK